MHHVNFSEVTRVKEMIIRERYILNVTISSSCKAKATIENRIFDVLNHPDFNQNNFELSVGVNSLRFLISPKIKHSNRVNLRICINNKEYNAYTPDVIIEENKFPLLTYSSQFEIISNIKNVIDSRAQDSDGLVVTVLGRSSIGKSYILKNLYAEYLFRHESLYVDLDINEFGGINERYLCRIIIFLNYGNVFLYNSLRTSADAAKLKKLLSHYDVPSDITAQIRNRLIDGCIDYASAISIIYELSTQFNGFIIPTTKFKLSRLLYIDDVQNLTDIQLALIKKIVCQIDTCKTNVLIVLSATQDAFRSIESQETYETLTPNCFPLNGLNKKDKAITLKNHFSVFSQTEDAISNIILPSSPLLASETLQFIMHEAPNASLYDIIVAFNQTNERSILTNKFAKFEQTFYLLDIISLFKLGITQKYLFEYPLFSINNVEQDIKLLMHAGILTNEIHNKISFSHDLYNQSYQKLRSGRQFNQGLGAFLKYWYDKIGERDINKNILLSNLIRCDEKYLDEYQEHIFNIIVVNAENTNFNISLYYCEYYFKMLCGKTNIEFTKRERYILYLYSDCLVHCGQSGEAEKVFEQILDSTQEDSLEYLEIRISLLNQWFWSINKLNILIGDSLLLQQKIEQLITDIPYSEISFRLKKCESSCYNRRMVTQLLLDECDSAFCTYRNWLIKSAQRVKGIEFKDATAVTIMDFARGISYYDIALSKRLMRCAYSYMQVNSEKNFRRLIICKIDLFMLQSIIGEKVNINEFKNAIRMLAQNNFRSECFKAVLKFFAMKLINESTYLSILIAGNTCSSSN